MHRLTIPIVVLASLGMSYYHLGVFIPHAIAVRAANGSRGGYSFGNDFYPIWLTSREARLHHRNPYDPQMTREIQTGLFGHALDARNPAAPSSHYREFAYPAYVDLLFWPVGLLPFAVVRIVLAGVLAIITALSVPLWMRALQLAATPSFLAVALVLTLSSYAVLEGLFAAQPGLIVGFLLPGAFVALVNNRFFLAGSLLALTFIKPQVSILVAGYLLLWSISRWRTRRGFALGLISWTAVLVTLSLIIWPHWIVDWLHVLSGYGRYSPPPLLTYSLGSRLGPHLGPPLIFLLLAAAVPLAWKMRRLDAASPSFALTVSLLLALTSITLLPGQAVYDHVILLPGILLVACTWRKAASSRSFRMILIVAALVLFWQWITAVPLLAARWFMPDRIFFDRGLWLIPFHAAASVPLAVFAVLGYLLAENLRQTRAKHKADLIPAQHA
jgi:hypothetical protein